jgi:hypothetical protein
METRMKNGIHAQPNVFHFPKEMVNSHNNNNSNNSPPSLNKTISFVTVVQA